MTWPAIVFWALIIAGMLSEGPLILYVSGVAVAFQTLQMVPGELVGGTNFLPGSLCTMFLVLKILARQKPRIAFETVFNPTKLGLLFAFYIWCVFSAYTMPRLFAGRIEVMLMFSQVTWPVLLEPTTQNITQPAYLTISVFSALAGYVVASNCSLMQHWLKANVACGLALVVTGIIDAVFSAAGQSAVLDPFRNTTHVLLAENVIGGLHRMIGFMDEASVYGSTCVVTLATLAFTRPCFEPRWRDKIVPGVCFGLLGASLLSTSSTAYLGLVAFALLYGTNWVRRINSVDRTVRSGVSTEAAILVVGLLTLIVLVTFWPSILDPVYTLLDEVVFNKSSSSSYEERSMWTRTGLNAFFATYGLGAGFGSVRTSNWFVAELSNAGLIGSFLLALFIVQTMIKPVRRSDNQELSIGLKYSLLPGLVVGAVSGTTPDLLGGMLYGMIIGLGFESTISIESKKTAVYGRDKKPELPKTSP